METKLKFYQTVFLKPENEKKCLCFDKYIFQVLYYFEAKDEWWDENTDSFYPSEDFELWAYLPEKECTEFAHKTTIK